MAEATIQRKDSLLMQAQQQWKTIEVDWNQRLALADEEKERLVSVIRHHFHASRNGMLVFD